MKDMTMSKGKDTPQAVVGDSLDKAIDKKEGD